MRRAGYIETNPLNRLREEMERLFGSQGSGFPLNLANLELGVFPALNVWEENEVFHVEAEVPGLNLEDLDISVKDDTLTIKGERKASREEGAAYHRRERSVGQFERSLELPAAVDATKVEARLKDGVLRISLPKAEAAKARKIPVKSE